MYARFVKRILDLLFALLVLPFVALVVAAAAIAIRAEDGGPVFYNAQRMGRNGRPFTMYKLRTMHVNAADIRMPDGSAFSSDTDPRSTNIGRRLRKASIDELPQIINIIKGEMSFIGPRPDDLTEAGLYVPPEQRKLEQRPGISGYAQVYGRNAISWRERLVLDVVYVDNISLALDIRIFFKTFSAVFSQKDVYAQVSEPEGGDGGEERAGGKAGGENRVEGGEEQAGNAPAGNGVAIHSITLAVVAKGESDYLPALLADITAQDYSHWRVEVLLIDSDCGNDVLQRRQMEQFAEGAKDFWRVAILNNPKKTLPAGCNIALAEMGSDALVRIDAHARIPADFLRRCVEVLEEGHDVVGGPRPVVTDATGGWAATLLAAETSVFGASAAGYRREVGARPVNSLFHGAYRREVLQAVGNYDERLHRTEDNDYSQRIRSLGFELYFDPRIHSEQYLRPTFAALLNQKLKNGFWIGRTMWIKPRAVSPMHLVPLTFVLALLACLVWAGVMLRPWSPTSVVTASNLLLTWSPLLALTSVYLLADCLASLQAAFSAHPARIQMLALPLVFLCLHLAYGFGTLSGWLVEYYQGIANGIKSAFDR